MMHNWFECSIRYEKVMEDGKNKKVTESYLVDALSFTEAEARIIQEMTPFITGEFTVSDIKRKNYTELFASTSDLADKFYKVKLYFITLDEKSGCEKKNAVFVIVQASDLRDAVKRLDEGMKDTMADYEIASVSETPIMDIYPFSASQDEDNSSDKESIRKVIISCPAGSKCQISIFGKLVTIDRTGKDTKIIPSETDEQEAIG